MKSSKRICLLYAMIMLLMISSPLVYIKACLAGEEASRVDAKVMTSFLLFDPMPAQNSGPATTPPEAKTFARKSLILNCPKNPRGVISSEPYGKGDWWADNFFTINGENICRGLSDQGASSCFQSWMGGGNYYPMPPQDISTLLKPGIQQNVFELKDYSFLEGSSRIELYTNCQVYN